MKFQGRLDELSNTDLAAYADELAEEKRRIRDEQNRVASEQSFRSAVEQLPVAQRDEVLKRLRESTEK